jgi:hypothetical protein
MSIDQIKGLDSQLVERLGYRTLSEPPKAYCRKEKA